MAPQILGPALTPLKDPGVWKSRLVDYDGVTAQALRDLVRWVEDDIAPPASTSYAIRTVGSHCRRLPRRGWRAAGRGGKEERRCTCGGQRRRRRALHRYGGAASGNRPIVAAEWDFTGTGAFERCEVDGTAETLTVAATHTYTEPGTYFASFRVGSHRDGRNGKPPFARNNARVRVIVDE